MKKILVIDDSVTVRQLVGAVLSGAGYVVIEAVDGRDGEQKIAGNDDLAMVICDVNMPQLNGLDMLASISKNPKHAAVPIVMLTTEGQPSMISRAKQLGAKGWIVKPFKPELLVAAVRKIAGA